MAALVCDICGGKLVMGAGGIAVCDSCGMEYSIDRMREKVQEIRGTIRVDNSHMIKNYLELATNAYDADNNAEAESYCNKIIEIDPANSEAWFLKGKSCGWQSTAENPRIAESLSAFVKAIKNCSNDETRREFVQETKEQLKNLSIAMISLRADRFIKWPDKEETVGYLADIQSIIDVVTAFAEQVGETIPPEEIMLPIATKINQSVVQSFRETVYPEYKSDDYPYPDKKDFRKFIERIGYCTTLVNAATKLYGVDDEESMAYYENLLSLENYAVTACAYDSQYHNYRQDSMPNLAVEMQVKNGCIPDVSNSRYWFVVESLPDEAKNTRKRLMKDYEKKIDLIRTAKAEKENAERKEKERIEEEEAQKRFDAYWSEHQVEKASLESEQKDLDKKISALKQEMDNFPLLSEKARIQRHIDELVAKKNTLGLFRAKEKKSLQEKIDIENAEVKKISNEIEIARSGMKEKMNELLMRYSEIEDELTMAR